MGQRVEFHRVLKAPVERVYRAFTDPDAKESWVPPYGFLGKFQSHDFREGGTYRMTFKNFTNQKVSSFGGKFTKIVPMEKLCYSDTFDDPNLPGEMTVEITFQKVICGTEIRIVQANIPEVIPAAFCYLGWQESLMKLAKLVEPEINQ